MGLHRSRRFFLRNTIGAAAAFTIIPRHVMGRGFIPPSDQLTKAIIGVGGIEDCGAEGLLRSIAVERSARSRGLGKRIVKQLVDDARADGRQSLYLLTTTAEDYFPSFGFVRVERDAAPGSIRATEEFSTICSASAIVMKLDLHD